MQVKSWPGWPVVPWLTVPRLSLRKCVFAGILTSTTALAVPLQVAAQGMCAAGPPTPRVLTRLYGSEHNPSGDRIGGGAGYSEVVKPGHNNFVVRNASELVARLEVLADRQVVPRTIYLDPVGKFDLDNFGPFPIEIPHGVTLASNRGHAAPGAPDGALVHIEQIIDGPMLSVKGSARLMGLRLQGGDPDIGPSQDWALRSDGITARGAAASLHVENCELSGWSDAAVAAEEDASAYVHHSYLHENQRTGLGYGVVFGSGGHGLVEANLFFKNRHAIASDGRTGSAYEARWNTVAGSQNGHTFDMHGWNDRCHDSDADECKGGQFNSTDAGRYVWIHHNTVMATNYHAVVIRGRPDECAWIENNHVGHGSGTAIDVTWVPAGMDDRVEATNNKFNYAGLQFSSAAVLPWQSYLPDTATLSALRFGDFDGDGIDDLLYIRPSDGHWRYYLTRARASGSGWFDLGVRVAGLSADDIAVGDFNGDGADDLFYTAGNQWRIAPSGTGPFQDAAGSGAKLSELRFGDFNGDGRTDVFRTSGTQWFMSQGGVGAWQPLALSNRPLAALRFGDFDGNGTTDVFTSDQNNWYISSGGVTAWTLVGGSGQPLSELRFGDFDGDRRTDVFTTFGDEWRISSGATQPWKAVGSSGHPLSSFQFADLDGDRMTDVVHVSTP
jgi:VCBS repeat protein